MYIQSNNWLQKVSKQQAKPMPLPFEPPNDSYNDFYHNSQGLGIQRIDNMMYPETARKEKSKCPSKYFNAGQCGVTGLTAENKIVKYTDNKQEAETAQKLIGKNLDCLPVFYDVREIQIGLWAIVMEKLEKIEYEPGNIKHNIVVSLDPSSDEDILMMPSRAVKLKSLYPLEKKFINKYVDMINCLIKNGITPFDAHINNIGYKPNGNLAFFDLGDSDFNE